MSAQHWPQPKSRVGLGADAAASFYQQAKAQLGGEVSAIQDQALQAMNGWADDAQQAILSNLDPDMVKVGQTAVEGAQIVANGGGLNLQTYTAVVGLVFSTFGGPVAGALAASMLEVANVAGQAIMAVCQLLGVAASTENVEDPAFYSPLSWVKKTQQIPNGPGDKGDGTANNPGWQSVFPQIQAMARFGVFDCTGVPNVTGPIPAPAGMSTELMSGDKFRDFQKTLPSYLNGRAVLLDEFYARAWCEMQAAPPDDFKQFFYQLMFRNLENNYNASATQSPSEQDLLKQAVKTWNASRSASSTVTYVSHLGTWAEFNPVICDVMAGALQPGASHMNPITVNTGPLITMPKRTVSLHITPQVFTPNPAKTTVAAPISTISTVTPAKVAGGAAVVAGAGLLGTVIYGYATGKAIDAVLGGIWRGIKGVFR